MYCVNCGAPLPEGAKFCMQCGTKQIFQEETETVEIEKTFKEPVIPAEETSEVQEEVVTETLEEVPEAVEETVEETNEEKPVEADMQLLIQETAGEITEEKKANICPVCGKENDEDCAFCIYCGASLTGTAPEPVLEEAMGLGEVICPACGKHNDSSYSFCVYCASSLKGAQPYVEPVAEPVKEEPVKEEATEPVVETEAVTEPENKPVAEVKKANVPAAKEPASKKTKLILVSAIAIAVVAVIAGVLLLTGAKSIPVFKGASIEVTGYNGYARASITGIEAFEDKVYEVEDDLEFEMDHASSASKSREASSKYYAFTEMYDSLDCSWEPENGSLKNGDKVTFACTYNDKLSKYSKYKFTNLKISTTVSGLEEPTEVDLFKDIEVHWEYDGYGYSLVFDKLPVTSDEITYSADSSEHDGFVNVWVNQSEDLLLANGIIPMDGITSKNIYVGYKPERLTYIDMNDEKIARAVDNAIGREVNKCGSNLWTDNGVLLIMDWDVVSAYSSYNGLRIDYIANLENGSSARRTTYVDLYRTADGEIIDNTNFVPEDVGCSVKYGQWTND